MKGVNFLKGESNQFLSNKPVNQFMLNQGEKRYKMLMKNKLVHSDREIITCCCQKSSCIVKVKTKPVLVE